MSESESAPSRNWTWRRTWNRSRTRTRAHQRDERVGHGAGPTVSHRRTRPAWPWPRACCEPRRRRPGAAGRSRCAGCRCSAANALLVQSGRRTAPGRRADRTSSARSRTDSSAAASASSASVSGVATPATARTWSKETRPALRASDKWGSSKSAPAHLGVGPGCGCRDAGAGHDPRFERRGPVDPEAFPALEFAAEQADEARQGGHGGGRLGEQLHDPLRRQLGHFAGAHGRWGRAVRGEDEGDGDGERSGAVGRHGG